MSKQDHTVDAVRSAGRARALKRSGLMLSAAVFAIAVHNPAFAQVAPGTLPTGGVVVGGAATFDGSVPSTLTVNQTSDRAVINWNNFDIGSSATVNFAQPFSTSIAVNRVVGGTAPSEIAGHLNANGTVAILNSNGVFFSGSADVNVGGLIASTGDIDNASFMSGGANLDITSANGGEIVVNGGVSINAVGLAAFVAPTVRNSGKITATAGKVQLGAGTAFTLDLAGDGLLSIGVGASSPLVENNGQIFATGGRIQLTARQASAAVSQSISTRVLPATTATVDGNAIVLSAADNIEIASNMDVTGNLQINGHRIFGAGDVNVAGAGTLTLRVNQGGAVADTSAGSWINDALGVIGTVGGGTTISLGAGLYRSGTVINASNVTLDGQGVARIGWTSGIEDAINIWGDNVTVKNLEIFGPATQAYYLNDWGSTNSRGIFVNRYADNVTVTSNSIHDIRTGIIVDGRNLNAVITDNRIDNTKSGISVQYTNGGNASASGIPTSGITLSGNSEGTFGNEWGINVQLNGVLQADGTTITPSTSVVGGYSVGILGAASTAEQARILALSNANNGMSTQNLLYSSANRTRAYVSATGIDGRQGSFASSLASVQAGINAVVAGGTVNIGAGTFGGTAAFTRSLTLIGAGVNATTLTGGVHINGTMSDVVLKNFTVSGQVGTSNRTISNQNITTNLTVDGVRIDGLGLAGRNGLVGGQIAGVVSVTNSEFVNIRGFQAFDTGSSTGNNAITVGTFSNNLVNNTVGSIAFRPAPAMNATITIANNIVTNVGSNAVNNVGAVFKVFGGATVNFTGNQVSDVGLTNGPAQTYGSVLSVTDANLLNVTDNIFTNNNQVFAVGSGGKLPGVSNFTGNTFINNGVSIVVPGNIVGGGTINFGASNNFVAGAATVQHIYWGSSGALDLTGVSFNGVLASNLSLSDRFALEDLITHGVDVAGFGLARTVAGEVYVTTASNSGAINRAVALAGSGDTLHIANGTYDLGTTQLALTRSINLVGQSQAGVILDGRTVSNGGGLGTILVAANNTSLSGFTLYGSEVAGGNYGIKVQPDPLGYTPSGGMDQRINNISLSDITVRGSRRGELDINGAVGVTVTNFTADGRRVADGTETQGAGVQITDSADVTLTNVHTLGNSWGGVALYQTNRAGGYNGQTTNINIDAANSSFAESLGLFTQLESTTQGFGTLNLTGFNYAVRNTGHRAEGSQFVFYRTDLADATSFALSLGAPTTSSIEGYTGTALTNQFTVVDGMGISAATRDVRDGGTVNVGAGTYAETVAITRGVTLSGAGMNATSITGGMLISGTITGLNLRGFSVSGTGNGSAVVNNAGLLTNLTMNGVRIDGSNVANRFGFIGGQIGGDISITNSQFLNIRGWAAFDTRSGAGGNDGAQITSATFSNNLIDNTIGHIAFRQQIGAPALPAITISSNTVTNVGNATNSFGAIFKTFNASTVDFSGNNVSDVGTSGFNPAGEAAYGAVLMTRGTGTLNVTGNSFTNNNQVFAVEPGRGLPTQTNFSGNTFTNNRYSIYLPANVTGNGTINFGAGDNFVTGANTAQHIVWRSGAALDLTTVLFNGALASDMSLTDQFALENLITHGVDVDAAGLARVVNGQLFVTQASGSIHRGVALAGAGDTLHVGNGTYDFGTAQLALTRSINLVGQSQAGVIFDGRAVSANGLGTIHVRADNTSLSGFTLYGSEVAGGNYGIKVQPDPGAYDPNQRVNNISLSDITVRGSRRGELDINGAVGVTINNFTADGRRVADGTETQGAGVQITDSADVTLINVHTLGNSWGGVALYQTNRAGGYNGQTTNINISAYDNNVFDEALGLFSQIESTTQNFGTLNLAGYNFTVRNAAHRAGGEQFTFYRTAVQDALNFAVNLNPAAANSSVVQGWNGSANTGEFVVGFGSLNSGGVMALSIQTAFNASAAGNSIYIGSGVYNESATLNGARALTFSDVTLNGLTLNGVGTSLSGTLTSLGSISFANDITLTDATSLTAADNLSLAGVTGLHGLTLSGNAVSLGPVTVASLTAGGGTIVSNGAVTIGDQNYSGATTLNGSYSAANLNVSGATTLSGDTGITAGGVSLGTIGGAYALTVDATAAVSLGAANGLGSLAVAGASITSSGATTSGAQSYTGATTLNGAYSASSFEVTGASILGSETSVTADGVSLGSIGGAHALTVNASGAALLGAANGLTSLAVTGATIASNGASTTGAQNYTGATRLNGAYSASDFAVTGAATLGGDTGITAGVVSLGTIGGTHALSVNATGAVSLGSVNGLTSLAVAGTTIASNGASTSGAQSYSGATILNGAYSASNFGVIGASTLGSDTGITAGDVSLGATGGARALSVNATGAVSIGAVNGLSSLAVTGASIASNGASTSGAQSYTGATTLNGSYSGGSFAVNGATTLGADASITGSSVSLGQVGGAHALTINASGAASLGTVQGLTGLDVTGSTIAITGAITTGAQRYSGATTLNGLYATGGADFTVNGATIVGGATSVGTNGGNASFGTVSGTPGANSGMTVNAGAGSASLGAVNGLTSLAVTGATITSNGASTSGTQSYTGALTLNGVYSAGTFAVNGVTILGGDTGISAGSVSLGTIGGVHALTVNATDAASLGAVNGLTSLAVTGATIAGNGAATIGTQSYTGATTLNGAYSASNLAVTGAATLGGDTSIAASNVTLGATSGAHVLSVNASNNATLGAVNGLTSLAVTGATIASNGASTTGAQSYTGATALNGAYSAAAFTVTGDTGLGSDTSITGTNIALGGISGAHDLTVNGGAISLGLISGIADLDVTGATIATNGAVTNGAQRYTGATTLNGSYTTSGGQFGFTVTGAATLGSAVQIGTTGGNIGLGATSGGYSLSLDAGTGNVSLGAIAVNSFSVAGASIFSNGASTAGAQIYSGATSLNGVYATSGGSFTINGAVTLAGATGVSTGGGAISLGTVDGARSLTLDAGNGAATLGAFGGVTQLGALTVNAGQTVLNAANYRANSIAFTGGANATVRLTQGTTTFTASGGGAIAILPQLIGTVAGAQNVVFAAGTGLSAANDGNITIGNAGSDALRLGAMTANGRNFLAQTVKLAGNFTSTLSGTQVFSANTLDTLGNVRSTVLGSESGSIRAGGSVVIQSSGSGAGSVIAGGPVTLSYATDVTRAITSAGAVSIAASGAIGGSVSGTQVNLQGGTGAISTTVNATGPVTIAATSGSVGGSVTSSGPVTITTTTGSVGSNVTSGGATTIDSGSGAVTSIVNSAGPINIDTGGSISGTLTTTGGGAITLTSDRPVNVQVNGAAVTINAPGGVVTGVFSEISTDASGTFLINQAPVIGTGVSDARQIIIDQFVVPAGGTVSATGEIQLPVGLALGLIAPAGRGEGGRPPVVVNSVSRLGELLRVGYTAIIIQLDESNVDLEEELVAAE